MEDSFEPIVAKTQSFINQLLKINLRSPSDPIVRQLDCEDIQDVRDMTIPGEQSQEVSSVIQEALSIYENHLSYDHPNCFAYLPSTPSPLAWTGDLLTSIFNANTAEWKSSSGPCVVEHTLIRWLANQVGLPPSAGGCFVSGGSIANLSAIVTARDKMLPVKRRSDGVVYLSDQTHMSVSKGLRITGFCDYQIRVIPTDDEFRMDVTAISQAIATDHSNNRLPFLIVATCGATNTGTIDSLHKLADVVESHGLWLHVDGAYGASIALSSSHQHLVDGLGRADSITWDAHKWLFQTYGCGIILTKDFKALEDSFSVHAEYIRNPLAPDGSTNFYNVSPELSRPARAIPLWFTLKTLGQRKVGDMIDQGFEVALAAEKELRKLPNWEIVSPATARIVVFRYAPPGLDDLELDALNAAISKRVFAENIAAILNTTIRSRTVFRLCSLNPETQPEKMASLLQTVNSVAESELGCKD